jgi:hypothetical protein
VQGIYRITVGSREVLESFGAASGPAGWRYFGRAHEPDSGREVFRVDYVVDSTWSLVRFRWTEVGGSEVVAIRRDGGVEAWIDGPGGGREVWVPDADSVWSASPSSLLVLDRLLQGTGEEGASVVRLEPPFEPRAIAVRLRPVATREIATLSGMSEAREVSIEVDGRRSTALLRPDLPIRAEGWFELVG